MFLAHHSYRVMVKHEHQKSIFRWVPNDIVTTNGCNSKVTSAGVTKICDNHENDQGHAQFKKVFDVVALVHPERSKYVEP